MLFYNVRLFIHVDKLSEKVKKHLDAYSDTNFTIKIKDYNQINDSLKVLSQNNTNLLVWV